MKLLNKIFTSKSIQIGLFIVCICGALSIKFHTLFWHLRYGNIVEFENVTITVPWDWILQKKDPNCYTFFHPKSDSAVTIGKMNISQQNIIRSTYDYERIMYIDGRRAYWGRDNDYKIGENNNQRSIRDYIIIPSEQTLIVCLNKKENIPIVKKMLSSIFFTMTNELTWFDEEIYYSNIIENQKKLLQQEIQKQSGTIGKKILLANEFVDWLKEQNIIDEKKLLEIPTETKNFSIKDAEAIIVGVVDGYYPDISLAFNESGRRIAFSYNFNLLGPDSSWFEKVKFLIKQGCSDIYIRVNLAHTKRISDGLFLLDPINSLFVIAHETVTTESHSLSCIDEAMGIFIPIYLLEKFFQEKEMKSEKDRLWAIEAKKKVAELFESFSYSAKAFQDLYSKLSKNSGDRFIISQFLRDNYLSLYGNSDSEMLDFGTKLFINSIIPARDDKIGWSYIMDDYPYYMHYNTVRKIFEEAFVHHNRDIIKVCKDYMTMKTPVDQFYKTDKDTVKLALDTLKKNFLK